MSGAGDRGQFDWLVELGGALAPAAAAGFAALQLAPSFDAAPATAMVIGSLGAFVLAYAVMRAVAAEPRQHGLAPFKVEQIGLPEELLLDVRYEQPSDVESDNALLLDDPLGPPDADSRVVRLFAPEKMPTAGQLLERIDRHLAEGPRPDRESIPDATDALYQALAELRRSLR